MASHLAFLLAFKDYYLVIGLHKRTLVLVAVASSKRKYGYWKPRLAKTTR